MEGVGGQPKDLHVRRPPPERSQHAWAGWCTQHEPQSNLLLCIPLLSSLAKQQGCGAHHCCGDDQRLQDDGGLVEADGHAHRDCREGRWEGADVADGQGTGRRAKAMVAQVWQELQVQGAAS